LPRCWECIGTRKRIIYIILALAPILAIILSLFIGRYPVSLSDIGQVILTRLHLANYEVAKVNSVLIWDIRLPRAILGAMVGACLAVSGAAFQGLFRNPLVSSGILGVSSGAGFGAALAIILFHGNTSATYIFAFGFALLAVFLSYMIGQVYNTTPTIMLVLGGVIVSSVFSSLISFTKYVADPFQELPSIVFWLMGSLASADYQDIMVAGVPMLAGVIGLLGIRWRINVLSMGDKEAHTLGVNLKLDKAIVILAATLATAGAVCVSGIIGWVGLIIPHISRMLVGNDNRLLIPSSMALGACFLVLVDDVGRVITGSEIPLGILTALIGAPFFVWLLKKTKGGGW